MPSSASNPARPRVVAAVLALLLALGLAGCGQVGANVATTRALGRAGVKDPIVTIQKTREIIVTVDYRTTAATRGEVIREQNMVAETTWDSVDVPLQVLRVQPTGGAAGAAPSRDWTRAALVEQFGPRPAELDQTDSRPLLATWLLLIVVMFLVALLLAVTALIWFLRGRRRRAAAAIYGAGYPGWEQGVPPPPPVRQAPAARPAAPRAPEGSQPAYRPATAGHSGYPAARARQPEQQPPAGREGAWSPGDEREP
jgi:hypothetical protein